MSLIPPDNFKLFVSVISSFSSCLCTDDVETAAPPVRIDDKAEKFTFRVIDECSKCGVLVWHSHATACSLLDDCSCSGSSPRSEGSILNRRENQTHGHGKRHTGGSISSPSEETRGHRTQGFSDKCGFRPPPSP